MIHSIRSGDVVKYLSENRSKLKHLHKQHGSQGTATSPRELQKWVPKSLVDTVIDGNKRIYGNSAPFHDMRTVLFPPGKHRTLKATLEGSKSGSDLTWIRSNFGTDAPCVYTRYRRSDPVQVCYSTFLWISCKVDLDKIRTKNRLHPV